MKNFEIPTYYRSSYIASIKNARKIGDPKKQDFTPTLLDFGTVHFYIARHFGLCYGVENAIEIAYKALAENPDKRIFLLSQMIHNPIVNEDLQERGIRFIMDTNGNQLINWDEINKDDIVIIPAFGTTLEIQDILSNKGIAIQTYNTTCPFVEKVWKKSDKLGEDNHTVIIHGKHNHEETKATFSHAIKNAPALMLLNINEAQVLCDIILGKKDNDFFYSFFKSRYSKNFDVEKDLLRIGIVNQTTMLAKETQAISELFKQTMIEKYGAENYKQHYADTRDTLCYATNDNQEATYGLLKSPADIAIVVGGYNSSNTSHIVELCEEKLPTYFISSADDIQKGNISHFDFRNKEHLATRDFLPDKNPVSIILTSGASCPDSVVDEVLDKILSLFPNISSKKSVLKAIVQQ